MYEYIIFCVWLVSWLCSLIVTNRENPNPQRCVVANKSKIVLFFIQFANIHQDSIKIYFCLKMLVCYCLWFEINSSMFNEISERLIIFKFIRKGFGNHIFAFEYVQLKQSPNSKNKIRLSFKTRRLSLLGALYGKVVDRLPFPVKRLLWSLVYVCVTTQVRVFRPGYRIISRCSVL